ncbi:MAG: hypothetical protein INQ03_09880 [Candidatus Heimdallarchaeota archaeon]|nr:hypothetical protein [Candidatus Heimdallarchaeota archaeon]
MEHTESLKQKLQLQEKLKQVFCNNAEDIAEVRKNLANNLTEDQILAITINNIVLNPTIPFEMKLDLLETAFPDHLRLKQLLFQEFEMNDIHLNIYLELAETIHMI